MSEIIKLLTDPCDMGNIHGESYTVGREIYGAGVVTAIHEHHARGEGDQWYYDVVFEDGSIRREFHPAQVTFAPPEDNK